MEMRHVTCPRAHGTDITVKLKRGLLHRNLKFAKPDGRDVINAELPATKKEPKQSQICKAVGRSRMWNADVLFPVDWRTRSVGTFTEAAQVEDSSELQTSYPQKSEITENH